MLRFIIRRKMLDRGSGLATESLETIDCAAPELERILRAGGAGHEEYDHRSVAGVEVLAEAPVALHAAAAKAEAIFAAMSPPTNSRDIPEIVAVLAELRAALAGVLGNDGSPNA